MSAKFSICVYCGSRFGADPAYRGAAEALGAGIANNGWRLVYGAGDVGLMGSTATAAMAAGGEALGVIPTHLMTREIGKRDLTHLIITETMHERKKVMIMNADVVALLPGGAGSLDEFFEALTWAQLGLHSKPILLINIQNYWGPLVTLIDHVIREGFADESLRSLFTVVDDVESCLKALAVTAS